MNTFAELGLSKRALASLAEAGFTTPTEIQTGTIALIGEGKDVVAAAETGSGKTAAYALPILDLLAAGQRVTRALVVVPTRELALQVKEQFDRFGRSSSLRTATLYGGVSYHAQVKALTRGADIIVATPGRLLDCVKRGYADLSKLKILVLDEADRLLDMGFMPQVRAVVAFVPKVRQTLMFSATIDDRMRKVANEFLNQPVMVRANANNIEPSSIDQRFHFINEIEKEGMLLGLVQQLDSGTALVFTRTRRKAKQVADRLRRSEVTAEEIHGDISQSKREQTLARYRKGAFAVLVATDIAARGLDIPSISHVINYDLPMCAADYVHRIGRTGRAGRTGIAHSFVSQDQRYLVRDIERLVLRKVGGEGASTAAPAAPRSQPRRPKFTPRRRVV